jgi:alkanesulfonate monooxygenase
MTAEIIWTIPTQGDGRDALRALRRRGDWNPERQTRFASSVRDERPGNFTYFDYLTQVSRAAEAAGFDGLFIPYDPLGEDSWITATALAREAPRLTLLPEFQPGFGTAVYAAKLALSFQRFFSDRLRWKLSLDGDTEEQRSVGDFVTGDDRIRRAEEFLTVTGGVWFESPFSFQGEYFQVEGGGFFGTGLGQELRPGNRFTKQEYPKLYLDGESEVALDLSARRADVHLLSKSEPSLVELAIARHQERAAAYGRQIEFGLRLGVIARETTAEAWRKAERLSSQIGADGDFAASRVDDQLSLGFSDLGFTAPSGLIGSYEEVADRLQAYVDLGISSFILDGLPHLEEAYRVGERVLARLGSRGLATSASL